MRYYPIFLDLRGRRCVVVGGGRVAERKALSLVRAGALVHVISPSLTPRLAVLAGKKKIGLTARTYRQGDLATLAHGAVLALVFAATNDAEAQREVRKEAEEIGALVNVASERDRSSFLVPASFTQGDLQVAISTSGASPALARTLRRKLQQTLGRDYRSYLRFMRDTRRRVLETVPDERQRARVFRQLTGVAALDWFRQGAPRCAASDVKKILDKFVPSK
jgi:precorrin-2 dehydrogenase/sirohydrochlorin ferrochelatase